MTAFMVHGKGPHVHARPYLQPTQAQVSHLHTQEQTLFLLPVGKWVVPTMQTGPFVLQKSKLGCNNRLHFNR
jgi:hypothetical protein